MGSRRTTSAAVTVLAGLATVAILLQGLWAGLFLRGASGGGTDWVDVHARGGEVALVLVVLATVVAFIRVRHRRELWLGGAALAALLVVEAYLGGLIHDQDKENLTAVHVPLAMAIMGLAVWLFVRSRRPVPARAGEANGSPYPASDRAMTSAPNR